MVWRAGSDAGDAARLEAARRDAKALGALTSMGVGGVPEHLFAPGAAAEVGEDLALIQRAGLDLHVLGGGCNLLARDGTIRGAVLSTHRLTRLHVEERRVVAEAGVNFARLVNRAAPLGIPALSGCVGIPGSVGGVVFMNAGGRFGSAGDALLEVAGFERDGTPFRRRIAPGDLGYRWSVFRGKVVTEAVFARDPALDPAAARRRFAEALDWKRRTQPLTERSAGCIFKNPGGPGGTSSAGRLIDEAGLKGLRVGGASVSPVHANFIVNDGTATADDVHALIRLVQDRVFERHRVRLELEVEVW
jgi:UDP-N-acetylmuramate dehydrogenase